MNNKYLLNPFEAVYQDPCCLSDKPFIQELNQYAIDLENKIAGDFDLEYLTLEFAYNQLAFVRNGLILAKIKFLKLYKNYGNGTFASFCKEKLRKQRWQINDTIRASRVVLELMYAGFEILPANIAQAVALAKLTGEELIEKWHNIVNIFPPDKITAKTIGDVVNPTTESQQEETSLRVPTEVRQQIETEAFSRELSVGQFLQLILDFFLGNETSILQGDIDSANLGVNSHLLQLEFNTKNYKEKRTAQSEVCSDIGTEQAQRIWQEDLIQLTQE